jgi:hypothetical protein
MGAAGAAPQSNLVPEEDGSRNPEEAQDQQEESSSMSKRYTLGVLAYLVPTFALGFIWHLVLFKQYYESLSIYRADVIIPLGFLSMLVQAVLFAWIYDRMFAAASSSVASSSVKYAFLGVLLSWSFTTLAVGAKNIMSSVPRFMAIETAFTVVQWLLVAPVTVLAFRAVRQAALTTRGAPASR